MCGCAVFDRLFLRFLCAIICLFAASLSNQPLGFPPFLLDWVLAACLFALLVAGNPRVPASGTRLSTPQVLDGEWRQSLARGRVE